MREEKPKSLYSIRQAYVTNYGSIWWAFDSLETKILKPLLTGKSSVELDPTPYPRGAPAHFRFTPGQDRSSYVCSSSQLKVALKKIKGPTDNKKEAAKIFLTDLIANPQLQKILAMEHTFQETNEKAKKNFTPQNLFPSNGIHILQDLQNIVIEYLSPIPEFKYKNNEEREKALYAHLVALFENIAGAQFKKYEHCSVKAEQIVNFHSLKDIFKTPEDAQNSMVGPNWVYRPYDKDKVRYKEKEKYNYTPEVLKGLSLSGGEESFKWVALFIIDRNRRPELPEELDVIGFYDRMPSLSETTQKEILTFALEQETPHFFCPQFYESEVGKKTLIPLIVSNIFFKSIYSPKRGKIKLQREIISEENMLVNIRWVLQLLKKGYKWEESPVKIREVFRIMRLNSLWRWKGTSPFSNIYQELLQITLTSFIRAGKYDQPIILDHDPWWGLETKTCRLSAREFFCTNPFDDRYEQVKSKKKDKLVINQPSLQYFTEMLSNLTRDAQEKTLRIMIQNELFITSQLVRSLSPLSRCYTAFIFDDVQFTIFQAMATRYFFNILVNFLKGRHLFSLACLEMADKAVDQLLLENNSLIFKQICADVKQTFQFMKTKISPYMLPQNMIAPTALQTPFNATLSSSMSRRPPAAHAFGLPATAPAPALALPPSPLMPPRVSYSASSTSSSSNHTAFFSHSASSSSTALTRNSAYSGTSLSSSSMSWPVLVLPPVAPVTDTNLTLSPLSAPMPATNLPPSSASSSAALNQNPTNNQVKQESTPASLLGRKRDREPQGHDASRSSFIRPKI